MGLRLSVVLRSVWAMCGVNHTTCHSSTDKSNTESLPTREGATKWRNADFSLSQSWINCTFSVSFCRQALKKHIHLIFPLTLRCRASSDPEVMLAAFLCNTVMYTSSEIKVEKWRAGNVTIKRTINAVKSPISKWPISEDKRLSKPHTTCPLLQYLGIYCRLCGAIRCCASACVCLWRLEAGIKHSFFLFTCLIEVLSGRRKGA